jgi:secondary thiamine-phosphate synthase enzyme
VSAADRAERREIMSTQWVEPQSLWAVYSEVVSLRTQAPQQFIDLTELLAERVRRSGVRHGLASVQVRHTTMAVAVNEDEPLLAEDVARLLDRVAPADIRYGHDDFSRREVVAPDERVNGAAHCRSLLLGASQALHVVDGVLHLGRWQRVFLVELDGPQARSVSVLVLGLRGES